MKKILALVVFLLAWLLSPSQAFANDTFEPKGPVKLIVPFPPGGGTDAAARLLGEKLSVQWKQQVIIENRSGAQGNIGTAFVSKANGDGLTLLLAHQGVFTVNPFLYKDIGFDALKDFTAVARVTQQPFVLVANPKMPFKTLKELETYSRSSPGKLSFGSSASGPQLAVEMFKFETKSDLVHVAYKGAGPAVVDVLAGHIDLMVANPASVAQHVQSGKLNALVLFGKEAVQVLPGAPTALAAGYPGLADIVEWYGIAVPASTPQRIVEQLHHDINVALQDPSLQARLRELGLNPALTSQQTFAEQITRDHQRWGQFITASGVKVEQ
jgi:tripartite-type tricarboxylate transporter receptor subunit TctC